MGSQRVGHDWATELNLNLNVAWPQSKGPHIEPLPWWLRQWRICGRLGLSPWLEKIPWKREWPPTPVFLPGEPHGQRSLVGYSPWGHKKSDTTEQLTVWLFIESLNVCLLQISVLFSTVWPICWSKFKRTLITIRWQEVKPEGSILKPLWSQFTHSFDVNIKMLTCSPLHKDYYNLKWAVSPVAYFFFFFIHSLKTHLLDWSKDILHQILRQRTLDIKKEVHPSLLQSSAVPLLLGYTLLALFKKARLSCSIFLRHPSSIPVLSRAWCKSKLLT